MLESSNSTTVNLHRQSRISHWNAIARNSVNSKTLSGYYHHRLLEIYKFHIPSGQRILELGCGTGSLLAALCPVYGVGIDFSPEMLRLARLRHPNLTFQEADVHNLSFVETFDVIILSDLVNELWDVQEVLNLLRNCCTYKSRVFINFYSHLWEHPLRLAQNVKLIQPSLPQNWLTVEDMNNLLYLSGFEVVKHSDEILMPLSIPLLSRFSNKVLAKMWPFNYANLTHTMVARLIPSNTTQIKLPRVSVVVPARNEEGNIAEIVQRIPVMGGETELIFVEGSSTDGTWEAIKKIQNERPELCIRALQQTGTGKGDAVRIGFAAASGDILMILDADLTVPAEDLLRFYSAIISGKGEFINGVRLVYPMEEEAMRFLNLMGNKFFVLAFSWLIGQPVKDTLCGTKVLWRKDYLRIAEHRDYFGNFDPFGDFDLLFGAARLNLKHVDIPIRYRKRLYGETNISRFSHGMLLLKMVIFAARKIKFI